MNTTDAATKITPTLHTMNTNKPEHYTTVTYDRAVTKVAEAKAAERRADAAVTAEMAAYDILEAAEAQAEEADWKDLEAAEAQVEEADAAFIEAQRVTEDAKFEASMASWFAEDALRCTHFAQLVFTNHPFRGRRDI